MLYSNITGKRPVQKPLKCWINAVEMDSESKKLEKRISRQASLKAPFKGGQG
jgi:hypothetical protein